MLVPVIERVNGIQTVRPGAEMFIGSLMVRPKAIKLINRRNAVYAAAFDKAHPYAAHQAAEEYTITVCQTVFEARAKAVVEARRPAIEAPEVTAEYGQPKPVRTRRINHKVTQVQLSI